MSHYLKPHSLIRPGDQRNACMCHHFSFAVTAVILLVSRNYVPNIN
jgi:hypothetical protein